MNQIEKVARALAAKHDKEYNTTGATLAYNAGSIATDYWNKLAKAAISAMRELDCVMSFEGSYAGGEEISFNKAIEIYQAMIDAALKE